MAKVSELGYLGVGAGDLAAWRRVATNVFGMQIVPGDTAGTSYLRIDDHHHRIELNAGGAEDLQFVGWEVPDAAALDAMAKQLVDGGIDVKAGTRDDAAQRRVVDFIKCADPSGIPTEIFYGHPVNPQPYQPSRAGSGFKTVGEGLGHILVYAPDIDASVGFYRDLLGFRVTDFTTIATPRGPLRLAFLHCNPRHHSIAFIGAPGPKRLNHIMFESNALMDVGIGRDACLADGIPIAIDLGCHMNDRMVSFYLACPSGFALEYGWGARVVDDATWRVEYYDSVDSIWGHPQLKTLATGGPPG
jgi:2,3-dihydroxybiphenyl 1,2-dioxygenase